MFVHRGSDTVSSRLRKPRRRSQAGYSALTGFLFISPWLLGFILLKLVPILTALGYSLTNFRMIEPEKARFIGLANYANLLKDQAVGYYLFRSIGNFLFTVPVQMAVALALAAIFSSERLRGKRIFRTLYFMPSIIPAAAIYVIISGLTDVRNGWLNQLVLEPLDLPSSSLNSAFPFVLSLWSIGPSFLIMLGAIQGVSKEIYEAARVDGAGPILRFFAITLPIISPAIFFSLVINMTNAFGGVVLLDRGLPFNQSLSPMESYINFQMFSLGHLGYASALTWLMFVVVMTIALVIFRSARYWVYFPEEEDVEEF